MADNDGDKSVSCCRVLTLFPVFFLAILLPPLALVIYIINCKPEPDTTDGMLCMYMLSFSVPLTILGWLPGTRLQRATKRRLVARGLC
jgi:hypothetical protein